MSEAKAIELKAGGLGDRRVIYVMENWPARALINTALIEGDLADHVKVGETPADYTLSFENGAAHYKKLSEVNGVATLELQDGHSFTPPPTEIPAAPASNDTVAEEGNAQDSGDRVSAYVGPRVGEVVLHGGERKQVLATRASASGNEVSFNKVDYFPVAQCEPAN